MTMRRSAPRLHAIHCACHGCAQRDAHLRSEKALRHAGRVLLVAAALVLIPFIMVISIARTKGEGR